jgi:hypothetical protein
VKLEDQGSKHSNYQKYFIKGFNDCGSIEGNLITAEIFRFFDLVMQFVHFFP